MYLAVLVFIYFIVLGLQDILKSRTDEVSSNFYLSSLVVDKVILRTKHNDDHQIICESRADGSFNAPRDDDGYQLGRGTEIILFLKEKEVSKINPLFHHIFKRG